MKHIQMIPLFMVGVLSLLTIETNSNSVAYAMPALEVRTSDEHVKFPSYIHHVARKSSKSSSLVVSPTSLTFTERDGAFVPQTEEVTISKKTRSKTSTAWTVTTSAPWLSLSTYSGTTGRETDTITVIPTMSGLVPGTYNEILSVTPTNPSAPARSIHVSLTVVPADPSIAQTPTAFSFSAQEGALNPASQVLSLTNQGGGSFSWSMVESIPWLTLNANSGTTTNETDSVNLTAQISGLAAGTYSGMVQVQSDEAINSPIGIPITLTLTPTIPPASAVLQWSPNTELDLAGYKVYQSTRSGAYGSPMDVGNATSHSVTNLQAGTTYYFSVTAYDTSLNESVFAPEVSISVY